MSDKAPLTVAPVHSALHRTAALALRALQFIFAVIVIGTDGYAIHVFRGYTTHSQAWFGDFDTYNGVPNAWGFLLFCAGWTIVSVIFLLFAKVRLTNRAWIGYLCVAIEAVALLSWLAGFIAVAVNIGSTTCPTEEHGCDLLKAATAFGAAEWLLFVVTAFQTTKLVFKSLQK